jgi:membrane associated rhomboid family serine protease
MRGPLSTMQFGFGGGMTPIVRNIMIASGIIWIAQLFADSFLLDLFALQPDAIKNDFAIWQLVTYMFLHGSFFHLFWNMFALWMFGGEIERQLGSSKFLQYYILTGMGGGLFQLIANWGTPSIIIGASAAIYGVLIAFGLFFPNRVITLLLFFILPVQMKAKTLVAIYIGISLVMGFQSQIFGVNDSVAHLAHLGGAFAGFVLLRGRSFYAGILKRIAQQQQKRRDTRENIRKERIHRKRKEIDEILDRINEIGYDNIPQEDKDLLKQASEFLAHEEKN